LLAFKQRENTSKWLTEVKDSLHHNSNCRQCRIRVVSTFNNDHHPIENGFLKLYVIELIDQIH
jgi:hypothetical protein